MAGGGTEKQHALLNSLYHDHTKPYGLGGARALYKEAKKIDKTITFVIVKRFLHSDDTYTKFYPFKKKVKTNRWVPTGIDSHHMADLAMLPSLKQHNRNNIYILIVVDVLSRFMFARGIANKEAKTTAAAYRDIVTVSGRVPIRLITDKGLF